jgi:hypothetical protein
MSWPESIWYIIVSIFIKKISFKIFILSQTIFLLDSLW